MTTFTKIAALALITVVASTSFASAFPIFKLIPIKKAPVQHGTTDVECRIHGDDFYIINWGNVNLDSGRQISWASPDTGDSGVLTVPKMLAPGEEVRIADLLSDFADRGARCDVSIA